MRRREFITLVGGAAASWPRAARAQQPERVRRIAALMSLAESDAEGKARLEALRQALQGRGWIEGKNLHVEYRWAGGEPDRMRNFAKELTSLNPELIFGQSSPVVRRNSFRALGRQDAKGLRHAATRQSATARPCAIPCRRPTTQRHISAPPQWDAAGSPRGPENRALPTIANH